MLAMKKNRTVDGITLEEYPIPSSWWCPIHAERKINSIINCASCGCPILYAPGKCYESSEILYANGNGFMVCPKCRSAEIKAQNEWLAQCMEAWEEERA